jgi:uncharacterized lipoprotein YmbA
MVLPVACGLLLALAACSSDDDQTSTNQLPPQDFGPNAQPGPPMPGQPDMGIGLMGAGQVEAQTPTYVLPSNSYTAPTTQQ